MCFGVARVFRSALTVFSCFYFLHIFHFFSSLAATVVGGSKPTACGICLNKKRYTNRNTQYQCGRLLQINIARILYIYILFALVRDNVDLSVKHAANAFSYFPLASLTGPHPNQTVRSERHTSAESSLSSVRSASPPPANTPNAFLVDRSTGMSRASTTRFWRALQGLARPQAATTCRRGI